MQISNTGTTEGVEIITVEGEVDIHASPKLLNLLRTAFRKNAKGIVVDLTAVPFMDSSGIATLVEGLRWSKNEGARFILVGLQENVSHSLNLTKLKDFFEISPTQEDALGSIGRTGA